MSRHLVLFLAIAIAAVGFIYWGNAGAIAQEPPANLIGVTGRGTASLPATLADIRLGVQVSGESAASVQEEVARRSNAVIEFLRQRDVQRLQTTGISLQPIYESGGDRRRLTGYTGTNIVSFRTSTETAGTLLDGAIAAGATRIDGINFTASEEAIAEARDTALAQATADARRQARAVLETLNLTAQDIVGIQVDGATAPLPQRAATLRAESAAPTPIIGGEQDVNAAVTLQIRY